MLITVSRKSWHYRVWKFMQDPARPLDRWTNGPDEGQIKNREREPTAICGYFWTIVLAPFVCLMVLVFLPLLVLAISLVIAPFYGLYRLCTFVGDRVKRRDQSGKQPSLIVTSIRATKTRICPRIVAE